MYSMILMSALAAGPETPQFNGYFRDLFSGCHGCCGGSCSGAYTAASCHGCCGGGLFSGDRVRSFFSLYGGCCGGCCGGYVSSGFATSCSGCCGGCHGSFAYGSGCIGSTMPMAPIYDGGSAIPLPAGPLPGGFDVPPASPRPAPPPYEIGDGSRGFRPQLPAPPGLSPRATVTVRLPADARLFAEGQPLVHSGGEKTFVTPELPPGRDFTYTFRAEYARDGEKVARERQLSVRSGGTYAVEFDEKVAKPNTTDATGGKKATPEGEKTSFAGVPPTAFPLAALTGGKDPATMTTDPVLNPAVTKEQDRAKITVKLPAGATLYVDGRKNAKTDLTREFVTPPLAHGKEYTYTMTAELGGPAGTLTHKVSFRAGETVTVDFTAAPSAAAGQPADALAVR